jgi:hypothetical protein
MLSDSLGVAPSEQDDPPDEAPEIPTDEPQPAPVQDPPAEPDPTPYVVRDYAISGHFSVRDQP